MSKRREPIRVDTVFAPAMRDWLDEQYDSRGMSQSTRDLADNWFRFHPWDLFAVRDSLGLESMFVER